MPTPRRKPPTSAARRPARPQGTWARIRAEALKDDREIPPYVIEDVDPPIEVAAPETAEQQLALGAFFTREGEFNPADAKAILEVVCGDSFPAVWELVRKQKLPVLLRFIQDMGEWFEENGALEEVDEEDVPGGSPASSN